MKKRVLATMLSVSMLVGITVGCAPKQDASEADGKVTESQDKEESEDAGTDSSGPIELEAWGAFTFDDTTGIKSYSDQIGWKNIEKALNLKINWTVVASSDAATQFGLLMASQKLPDFFTEVGTTTLEEYGFSGAIRPINDLVEDMPNFKGLMEKYPTLKGELTSADGNMYFFPKVLEGSTPLWADLMIRQDWLDQVGLEVPKTTEDYYQALKKIKEEIPGVTKALSGNIRPLIWSFGVGSFGASNTIDDTFYEDGEIKFGPTDDRYCEALEYLHKLYAEGLIDPSWEGVTNGEVTTNMLTGLTASTYGSLSGVVDKNNALFEGQGDGRPLTAILPLEGPSGKVTTQGYNNLFPSIGASISSTCQHPEAVASIFDYTYGKEGSDAFYFGNEGETYEVVDGKYQWTETVTSSPLGVLGYVNNYLGYSSQYPGLFQEEFYYTTLTEETIKANQESYALIGDDSIKVPTLRFTKEESETVASILRDLNTYVSENLVLFVNGTRDLKEWDDYKASFDGMRVDELLEIYNAALARQQGR